MRDYRFTKIDLNVCGGKKDFEKERRKNRFERKRKRIDSRKCKK